MTTDPISYLRRIKAARDRRNASTSNWVTNYLSPQPPQPSAPPLRIFRNAHQLSPDPIEPADST